MSRVRNIRGMKITELQATPSLGRQMALIQHGRRFAKPRWPGARTIRAGSALDAHAMAWMLTLRAVQLRSACGRAVARDHRRYDRACLIGGCGQLDQRPERGVVGLDLVGIVQIEVTGKAFDEDDVFDLS